MIRQICRRRHISKCASSHTFGRTILSPFKSPESGILLPLKTRFPGYFLGIFRQKIPKFVTKSKFFYFSGFSVNHAASRPVFPAWACDKINHSPLYHNDLGGGERGRRGTRGHTFHYSLPWGYWLLAATTSAHRYHQSVAGTHLRYLYSGLAENREIKVSRLVYRDTAHKTTVSLRGYLARYQNFIDDTEIEIQRRRMAGWGIGLGHRAFIGDAVLDLELAYRRGTGAFDALRAPEEASGEGTARPKIISAEASLSLPFRLFGQALRYHGLWRAQWNRTPLVPQDRFSIGGRHTVRGFDGESILMAERGFLVRNDISVYFGDSGQAFYLGADHGQVGGSSAKLLVGRRLTGAVAGLRGFWKGFSYDVFIGWPIEKPRDFQADPATTGLTLTASF
jgi:hemolysin activation/secretion protein